jgi:TRAP-type C4-dicarboxylate transport system permease small subunit
MQWHVNTRFVSHRSMAWGTMGIAVLMLVGAVLIGAPSGVARSGSDIIVGGSETM